MSTKPDKPLPTAKSVPPVGHAVSPSGAPPQMWTDRSRPSTSKRSRRSFWRQLLFFGLGLLIAVVVVSLVGTAGAAALFYRSDYIAPGVFVEGTAVGGLTTTEAVMLLQPQWPDRNVTLEADHTSQVVTAKMLGITIDTPATVQLAHHQGRSLATLRELINTNPQVEVPVVWYFDPTLARNTLQTLAPRFEVPAVEANIRFANGRVEAVPAAAGKTLNIQASLAQFAQNPTLVVNEGLLPLVMEPVEPALTDVSDLVTEANQLLANSVRVHAYDPIFDETVEWTIDGEAWSSWYSVTFEVDDPTRLDWNLDVTRVRTFLADQSEILGAARYVDLDEATTAVIDALTMQTWSVRLRIMHREQQYTVQPGESLSSIGYDHGVPYPWIEQANPGIADSLRPGVTITIPSPDDLVPLPVVEHKRVVVNLGEQKMRVYEEGQVKWEWPVSTGIASSPTAPGVFQVQNHEPNAYAASWNLWMPNFMGIYRPVPTSDFMNGFHGFPTRNGAGLLWTDDLGQPVTYGCILISSENATALYDWAETGVVVEVQH